MLSQQITNRNFLSPVGFKFTLSRSPKAAFFANAANIPDLTLGVTSQPTYTRQIPEPGTNINFGDFSIRFMVDEDLTNFMEIQNWIRGIGFPEDLKEIYNLQFQDYYGKVDTTSDRIQNIFSDGTLLVLSSNQRTNWQVVFKDMFPYQLSTLQFDATDNDIQYMTAEVSFKYTMYNIVGPNGQPLHPITYRVE